MQLSRLKKVFLILSCTLIFGFTWIVNEANRVKMKSWAMETDGPFVTPVSKVAMIRSDKLKARDIKYDEILDMVTRAVDAAGGLETIITDGDSVILKPNLVSEAGAVPEVNGITTDYRVVRAVSELVRRLNPSGWIGVLEGSAPSGQYTKDMFKLYSYTKSNLPAVDAIIALEDVCGNDKEYNSPELVSVSLPDSVSLYPDNMKPNHSRPIYLAKLFYNADVVISIPTLKNHESAALTAGVKNTSIGMTPPSIYRNPLYDIPNLRFEIDHSYPNMHKWIHDFFMCRPTNFVIVDGLQGMQNGPGGGSSPPANAMNMRLIMASRDIISLDAIAALTIGLDPAKVDYLVYLHNDGLGCADPKLIRVEGNVRVSDVKKKFAHSDARTIAAMYSDFTPPKMSITFADIAGDSLMLQLDAAKETAMVEIEVDGLRLDKAVVSGFGNIRTQLAGIGSGDHVIKAIAYDKYLNASEAESIVTAVPEDRPVLASSYGLLQSYPNPFNAVTTIEFRITQPGHVSLTVFNQRGEQVCVLVDGVLPAGIHHSTFSGESYPSGVYYYTLKTGRDTVTKRMVLLK
jgi:uncharacterized protein (DUF362 family)